MKSAATVLTPQEEGAFQGMIREDRFGCRQGSHKLTKTITGDIIYVACSVCGVWTMERVP